MVHSQTSMRCIAVTPPLSVAAPLLPVNTITDYWKTFSKERNITVNAQLLRYLHHTGDTIHVANDIMYRDLVGTRHSTPLPTPRWHVLSAIARMTTADGWAIWQERDSGDWPHSIELPGGFLQATHLENDGLVIDDFIKNRVAEDFALPPTTILETRFDSLFFNDNILEVMCLYTMTLAYTKQELIVHNPTHPFYFTATNYDLSTHTTHTAISIHVPSAAVWQQLQKTKERNSEGQ